nr:MAG TPA: hypothetical protein [Caudoviricetes sp.]
MFGSSRGAPHLSPRKSSKPLETFTRYHLKADKRPGARNGAEK